jgi:hypothetical protein
MKSKTNYVRVHHATELKERIKTYKKFKKFVEKWIALVIEHSKIKMDLDKEKNRIK